jgi:hypothetical protein
MFAFILSEVMPDLRGGRAILSGLRVEARSGERFVKGSFAPKWLIFH